MKTHFRVPLGRYLPPTGEPFVTVEALGGLALFAATVVALVWANVSPDSYEQAWSSTLTLGIAEAARSESLRHWVNDGLMAVFFFVVGLEIKRELVRGELRDRRAAALPVVAALGGMVVPAALYALVNLGGAAARGWGIPMATDIAFAIALLALLGDRVPRGAKIFLLTLAIVDDIGSILVIAVFYSSGVAPAWLVGAAASALVVLAMQRLGVVTAVAYIVPALALWVCMLESGVHATIAGVVLGLLTPAVPFRGRDVNGRLQGYLHPWSSFVVMPLFALANAGIVISGRAVTASVESAVGLGVLVGLVVGKPLGIVGATFIATRARSIALPEGLRWGDVIAVGTVAGMGFTVSLFVAALSFGDGRLEAAKFAVLGASVLSAVIGTAVCVAAARRRPTPSTVPRRMQQ